MIMIEYLPLTPERARELATAAEPGLVLPFGAAVFVRTAVIPVGLRTNAPIVVRCESAGTR